MAIKNYGKTNSEFNYDVLEKFGKLSPDNEGKYVKELRLISWNGKDPVYDLRGWRVNEDGTEQMTKGITFESNELEALLQILIKLNEE